MTTAVFDVINRDDLRHPAGAVVSDVQRTIDPIDVRLNGAGGQRVVDGEAE